MYGFDFPRCCLSWKKSEFQRAELAANPKQTQGKVQMVITQWAV